MLQRIRHLNKSLIRYKLWANQKTNPKLVNSFCRNFFLPYKPRLTFFLKKKFFTRNKRFYLSQNKLQCFLHYSFSVPSRGVRVSRFFLNKSVERLIFGGYQK